MSTVSGEIHIDAPKDKVWAVLADLGAVSAWKPGYCQFLRHVGRHGGRWRLPALRFS